jgi:hypothetical protein
MSWQEIRIETWPELVQKFDSLPAGRPWENRHLFRGQADEAWPLNDSIARLLDPVTTASSDYCALERIALRNFRSKAHLALESSGVPDEDSLLDWWALMQHFGCPTRLLDWTASPFVAAYFAAIDELECDGALWAFDRVALLQGSPCTKPGVADAIEQFALNNDKMDLFWGAGISNLICPFAPKREHVRLAAQQGLFTVCSLPCHHGDMIDNSFSDPSHGYCHKIIIPKNMKVEVIGKLVRMNVAAHSLFPGLDGLGRSTQELLKLSAGHLGLNGII